MKQMDVKTNLTLFLNRNLNWRHKTELKTWRHVLGQHKQPYLPFHVQYTAFSMIGHNRSKGRCCDRMVVGFTTTCAISAYHHWSYELESHSWWGVLDSTLCEKVCQWLATGWWFSPVSSTNKTDRHDITEILLKVDLNSINQSHLP